MAGVGPDGRLLAGYVDLVAVAGGSVHVVDFKTDAVTAGPVEVAYPEYLGQVRAYGGLLPGVEGARTVQPALLFTADGRLRQIAVTEPAGR